MFVTLFGIIHSPLTLLLTITRLVQPSKIPTPIVVTLFGIVMFVRPLQFLKALLPIVVTLSGIVMLAMFEHCQKAYVPILVTPLPSVRLVRPLQL